MLRLFFVIFISLPFVIYYMVKVIYYIRHEERYTEEERYNLALKMIRIMKRNGRIHTISYGQDRLPEKNGYIMYPNHQGKYDALGIIDAHERPCTVVIDDKASHAPITSQFIDLLRGVRLDKTDMRKQVKSIRGIAEEVKGGRNFIIFPEGGYEHNGNSLQEFLAGAFKCAQMSRSPIVPVAIYDSYKVFSINSIRKVRTQVSFLEPIFYEEYKGMNTLSIAQLVKQRIEEEVKKLSVLEQEYNQDWMNIEGGESGSAG